MFLIDFSVEITDNYISSYRLINQFEVDGVENTFRDYFKNFNFCEFQDAKDIYLTLLSIRLFILKLMMTVILCISIINDVT